MTAASRRSPAPPRDGRSRGAPHLRRPIVGGVLALLVLVGCGKAIDRPAHGAAPGSEFHAPTVGLPPTLQPSDALRFRPLPAPSPGLDPSPSPVAEATASPAPAASPSPAPAPPVVRTIAPGADGQVAAGAPVTVSAVLIGRGADLADASLTLDGGEAGAQVEKRSAREWAIRAPARALAPGVHTVRVRVRDASDGVGGFTWRFTVGDAPPPAEPATTPAPTPRTP